MTLIDEEGRLFGRVNVVDALVVLVVLAVVAAGIALVTGGSEPPSSGTDTDAEPETRYATVALGPQPTWLASAVQTGENVSLGGADGTATVTDVHLTGAPDGQVGVFARVEYVAGTPALRTGATVPMAGDGYRAEGQVRAVEANRSTLRTESTAVVVTTTLDPTAAAAVEAGDRYTVGNHTLATVESVTSRPARRNGERRLRMSLTLRTLTVDGEPHFADRGLRVGSRIPFHTSDVADLNGTVEQVGSLDPAGEPAPVTMTLSWENVRPEVADAIAAGQVETHRGATARVTDVSTEPATFVRSNEAGELFVREHPRNLDVTLTVRATARRHGSELRFHGRPLTDGETVALEFDSITLRGTVLDVETDA
ncbi:DUF4330 domain-containing protein [Halorientalis halophila]|uniref:DUF4330 domain-containing protein n=1 Tax=Halorientalis halophila TaxID=3108499 RepID=UPI00300A9ADE